MRRSSRPTAPCLYWPSDVAPVPPVAAALAVVRTARRRRIARPAVAPSASPDGAAARRPRLGLQPGSPSTSWCLVRGLFRGPHVDGSWAPASCGVSSPAERSAVSTGTGFVPGREPPLADARRAASRPRVDHGFVTDLARRRADHPEGRGRLLDALAARELRDLGAQLAVGALERGGRLHRRADSRVHLEQGHLGEDDPDEQEASTPIHARPRTAVTTAAVRRGRGGAGRPAAELGRGSAAAAAAGGRTRRSADRRVFARRRAPRSGGRPPDAPPDPGRDPCARARAG